MGAVDPTLVEAGAAALGEMMGLLADNRRITRDRARAKAVLAAPAVASRLAGPGECVVSVEDLRLVLPSPADIQSPPPTFLDALLRLRETAGM